ncbi:hypothetical protein F66182_2288 [Fusarium sp. NRRL 66182]|nr:hypothetical protein F66182_2288 [Fusarium sp. NRRL 66182]
MTDQDKNNVKHDIRNLTESDQDIEKIWQMWHTIFPEWPIEKQRMGKLLFGFPDQHHFIHDQGFIISSLTNGVHGRVAAVGVLPAYRRKGLGTALMEKAQAALREASSAGQGRKLESLEIGSIFPRYWPQVPKAFSAEVKEFFLHRGFQEAPEPVRDLFKDVRESIAPPEIMARVSKTNVKFSPWSVELYEECMKKQRAQFHWDAIYEALAAHGQHQEVMVAFDPETNEQIGWTLMCSPSSVASDTFAFLPLYPSGNKTGLIAAVGVDEKARGKGVGLALVVKAVENLRERGVEGILIDSVSIRGFYERLGFDVHWEYGVRYVSPGL